MKRKWYPRCTRTDKIRYPDFGTAIMARDAFIKSGKPDPGLAVYFGECCGGWHLGSQFRSLGRVENETKGAT